MENEKMMICPKAKECGEECFYPIHKTPHQFMAGSCNTMTAGHACPACILVPAQPELLTGLREEIAKELRKSFCEMHCRNDKSNKNCQFRFDCEDIYKPADAILLKCHQSEAAEIKVLNQQHDTELDNLKIRQTAKLSAYEARIKELEEKLQKQWEWSQGALDWRESEIVKARADQNRKIGEWLDSPCPNTKEPIYMCPRCVRQLKDKLHKGGQEAENMFQTEKNNWAEWCKCVALNNKGEILDDEFIIKAVNNYKSMLETLKTR